jgi:hypothetical protein
MQDVTVARLQSTRVPSVLPSSLSFKCNVLRESLSEESQNIPCATLREEGSWVISMRRVLSVRADFHPNSKF